MARPVYVSGMQGLGDCIHERAVVRELLKAGRSVWLETPWPCVFHDLPVRLVEKPTSLRTQGKNARRERRAYTRERPPQSRDLLRVSYPPQTVRDAGSVLAAMSGVCGVPVGDFRLPIPDAWRAKAAAFLAKWRPTKPLMIFRPLGDRTEWGGCKARNPDHDHFADLFESVRDRFFVVAVADWEQGREWPVGRAYDADVRLLAGELDFETLAALADIAGLVFTSPGFAAVLAQAVGTPVAVVFGGYENGSSFASGARFAPYLPIEPVKPCQCFAHHHNCEKRIDMDKAKAALGAFVAAHPGEVPSTPVFGGRSKVRPNVTIPPREGIDLTGLHTRYVNPGELETLITLVESVEPRTMIEVGCNSGRTAKAILRNVPSLERYVGIDVPPGYAFAKAVQAREVPPRPGEEALDDPRFRLLLARRGTFDLTAVDLPRADVVFIDGDHGEAAVRADHALALQLVRPGGLIIHHDDHDIATVDVRPTLDDLHTDAAPIAHVLGTWLAFHTVKG